jgi:hypothetical protein
MEGSGRPYGSHNNPCLAACLPTYLPMPHLPTNAHARARASKELPRRLEEVLQRSLQSPPVHGPGSIYGTPHDWPCYCDVQAGLVSHPGVGQWGAWCG